MQTLKSLPIGAKSGKEVNGVLTDSPPTLTCEFQSAQLQGLVQRLVAKEKQVVQLQSELTRAAVSSGTRETVS